MKFLTVIFAALALSACVTNPQQPQVFSNQPPQQQYQNPYQYAPVVQANQGVDQMFGTVTRVAPCLLPPDNNNGIGAVGGTAAGAAVGGLLGHQIGKGSGKKWATGAGAVLGGVVGHNLATAPDKGICVTVLGDNYRSQTFPIRGNANDFQPNRRVSVIRQGNQYQVTPLN